MRLRATGTGVHNGHRYIRQRIFADEYSPTNIRLRILQ